MRVNNLAFIIYPESQDIERVRYYLATRGYVAAISPLHTPDDEALKPHFHVLVTLSSPRELTSVDAEFNSAFNKTAAFKVGSLKGYARYLCHLDSPDKEQFPIGVEPICINGFEWLKYSSRKIETFEQGKVITAILEEKHKFGVTDLGTLILVFESQGLTEYVSWICSHAYLCVQLLR